MPDFQAFFSYARADAALDPELFEAFSTQLEARVSSLIANVKLTVWRDTDKIKTGDRWDAAIESAIKNSQLQIIMLSPNWLSSDYCRKEFREFEASELEPKEFVFPLLVQGVSGQRAFLIKDQLDVLDAIMTRQYKQALVKDFLQMNDKELRALVTEVATHIAAKIENLLKKKLSGATTGR